MSNPSDFDVHIYHERYETWRYLDRLRWQFVRFIIAGSTALMGALAYVHIESHGLIYAAGGTFLVTLSLAMFKVNAGIRANGRVLRDVGALVGDDGIPEVSQDDKSVHHWISVAVLVLGIMSFGAGLLSLSGGQ